MKLSILKPATSVLAVGLFLIFADKSRVNGQSSFSDLEIEFSENKVALAKMVAENQQLREILEKTEISLKEMRDSLASANGEAEIFKRQSMALKLRMETLGIEAAGGNIEKSHERILSAVGDLRAVSEENAKLSGCLGRLSESATRYAQMTTGVSADARSSLEAEIRTTKRILSERKLGSTRKSLKESTILDGSAISVKEDLSLVVVNLGRAQGVSVGMPFEVRRSGNTVGMVVVVDVRDKISGAIVQNLISAKDTIKVGDHLKVSALE